MRRVFAIIILLCIAYFIGGYIAVQCNLITQDQYLAYAGLIGGLASVSGLFSFLKPALTKNDLQELELDSLISLTKKTEQLKNIETQRSQAKSDLSGLEVKKKEMELLVKKASISLFLKEQHSQYEHKILSLIKDNEILSESLLEIKVITEKLNALEEEIESDPNVETLREVINSANSRRDVLDDAISEAISSMPSLLQPFFMIMRAVSKALSATVFTIK
jgi:hypothetical protein